MAQFEFLGTWNDSWNILAAILEHSEYSLVPDVKYDKPELLFVTKIDDPVKEMFLDRRNGFIWSTKFSLLPPSMNRIEGGVNVGKYYVSPTEGGPVLRLVLPACYEEGGVINLAPGMLSCPRATIKPGTNVAEKPSPAVRAGFKEVKAIIKRQLVRLKVRADIWSGQEASRLVEENRARIRGFERPGDSSGDEGSALRLP
jgi:hypothetical protein